jgi:diguanylate cyclase (GGDEF)-like protein
VFEFSFAAVSSITWALTILGFGLLCCGCLIWLTWRYSQAGSSLPLRWAAWLTMAVVLGHLLELLDLSLPGSILGFDIKTISTPFMVFAYFLFVLRYTGNRLGRRAALLVLLLPVIVTILVVTNPWHELVQAGPFLVKDLPWKPLFRERSGIGVGLVDMYAVMLGVYSVGNLWGFASRTSRIYHPQIIWITVCAGVPFFSLELGRRIPVLHDLPYHDWETYGIALMPACILMAVFRHALLISNPEAWGEALEISNDAEIVIRPDRSTIDANRPAQRLLSNAQVALSDVLEHSSLNEASFVVIQGRDYRITPTPLQGPREVIAYHFALHDVTELKHQERLLHELSIRDGLTGLFNRRYLDGFLEQAAQVRVSGTQRLVSNSTSEATNDLGVVLFDLDHFRQVNAKLGHPAGDHVLKRIGAHLLERASDDFIPCRYGGEEFCVLLPGHSSDEAQREAERLCTEVRDLEIIFEGRRISVTISVAVASWREHGELTLLAVADDALRRAKLRGRNRVERPSPVRSTWGIGWG